MPRLTKLKASFRGLCDYCKSPARWRYGPASKNGRYACDSHRKNAERDAS